MKKKYLAIFLLASTILVGCGTDSDKKVESNKSSVTSNETNTANDTSDSENKESDTAKEESSTSSEEPIDIGDPNIPEGEVAEGNDEIKIGPEGMTEEDATYIVAQLVDSSKYAFKTEEQSVIINGEDYYVIRLVDYNNIDVEIDPPLAVNKTSKQVYIYENNALSDFDASKF